MTAFFPYGDERLPRLVRDGDGLSAAGAGSHAALEKLLDYTLDADLFGLSRDHAVRIQQEAVPSRGPRAAMLFPPVQR